ncbi:MAG: LCP family protein [Actinobacteria bacterium]|nr:LCP family protein [Actinomycetota bacterium]
MGRVDKPYRVYRGGRARGGVPARPRPGQPQGINGRAPGPAPEPRQRRRRRRFGWGRRIALAVGLLLVACVAWGATSFLALQSGVREANGELEPGTLAALDRQDGLLLSKPTILLLLGTDHSTTIVQRAGSRRADSIMLLRTDPEHHRLAFLSIPRDLRVDIPGHGPNKINAAFQLGGAPLALQTVRAFTGLRANHVALVDFNDFRGLIDAVDGIEVDVPGPILANKFDCPYATQAACDRWAGWRFGRGPQEMDGRRALVYARIRDNRLNTAESDLTRGERQQQVVQAIGKKVLSPLTVIRLPFIAGEIVRPLTTDLSAAQFAQLGWLRFRSSPERTLRCRLGGTPDTIGGQAFLLASEENRNTIAMFTGAAAPQPPLPGSGPFGPGCFVGASPRSR